MIILITEFRCSLLIFGINKYHVYICVVDSGNVSKMRLSISDLCCSNNLFCYNIFITLNEHRGWEPQRAYHRSPVELGNNARVASSSLPAWIIYGLAREEAIVVMTKVPERLSPNKQNKGSPPSRASPEKYKSEMTHNDRSMDAAFLFPLALGEMILDSGSSLIWRGGERFHVSNMRMSFFSLFFLFLLVSSLRTRTHRKRLRNWRH